MNEREIKALYGDDVLAGSTPCDICSFGCPVTSYIRDGKIIGVDPKRESPLSRGFLCAKGYASQQYVYRGDRIKTPLKRIGKRGEGIFAPISWDEALKTVAEKLSGVKSEYGADSVAFFSGYTKWYRPYLHRLAHSFGTLNYGTESSSCFQATVVANKCSSGCMTSPDAANAGVIIGWAYNTDYSNLPVPGLDAPKKRGAKIIIVDPKQTPAASRLADVHLRPKPGTDGALALGIGRELIRRGLVDMDFIGKYVIGYDEYRSYADGFDPDTVCAITGVEPELLLKAVDIIQENGPLCLIEGNAGMIHHTNGVQAYRAVNALIALTSGYVKKGGNRPFAAADPMTSTVLDEERFINAHRPINIKPKIGSEKYPLWNECIDEYQAMELANQIMTGKPYPIKAVFALGMNARMFPDDGSMFEALENVDFFADADIFMTDTAKYADIVLPACTSFERDELRTVGRTLVWYDRAIEPLNESRSDTDIVIGLAKALGLDDELLTADYDACCRSMLEPLPVTLEQLKREKLIKLPTAEGEGLRFFTQSGKYELYSALAEKHGYEPLPKYYDPYDSADPKEFPLMLCSGGRLPNAFASRMHSTPWARELRKAASVDINPTTADKLAIGQGDTVRLSTSAGSVTTAANLTNLCLEDMICLYHGYSEADVNFIIPKGHNDPFSGFPGYRSVRCRLEKVSGGSDCGSDISHKMGALSFNSEKCTGCGACVVACMETNQTDLERQSPYRRLRELIADGKLRFTIDFCAQCAAPDCLTACPTGALKKDGFGLVFIDNDFCVGCFACQNACTSGMICGSDDGKAHKCDGCGDRVRLGLKPKCVDACRFGALDYKVTGAAAVILAGGKSSRMGSDKAELLLDGRTFLESLTERFLEYFENVYVSTAPGREVRAKCTGVIFDEAEGQGPLCGLYSALAKANCTVFLCATDLPFAKPELALELLHLMDGHDACVIRRKDGKLESTFAAFSKNCLPTAKKVLEAGKRSMFALLGEADTVIVDESQLEGFDLDHILMNVNTPEQYEKTVNTEA